MFFNYLFSPQSCPLKEKEIPEPWMTLCPLSMGEETGSCRNPVLSLGPFTNSSLPPLLTHLLLLLLPSPLPGGPSLVLLSALVPWASFSFSLFSQSRPFLAFLCPPDTPTHQEAKQNQGTKPEIRLKVQLLA